MAISNEKVKQIQSLTVDCGELIKEINPVTEKEWDAFNKLVDAHKNLMKVDTDSLLQLQLPLESKGVETPKPRKDCPRCHGAGEWVNPDDTSGSVRPCNCKDVDNAAWLSVKADWMKVLVTSGD